MGRETFSEVIVIGGGFAGLTAAVYLGRAKREVVVIDAGRSMARWEADVQNYPGFPDGISGEDLVARLRDQARQYGARYIRDNVVRAGRSKAGFKLVGERGTYTCCKLLVATGIFHIPPDIPGVEACLGHSMFFCKDCDGYRIQGKPVAIYGWTNEAVRYALGMLLYSPCVSIVMDGHAPHWDRRHANWIKEYAIPVYGHTILNVRHRQQQIEAFEFDNGTELKLKAMFTTRGDIYFNELATSLGADVDELGQIVVDSDMRTSVPGLYAAGCITPANCQMVIAAGEGATAAQAMNSDLLNESLRTHSLRRFRARQLRRRRSRPEVVPTAR